MFISLQYTHADHAHEEGFTTVAVRDSHSKPVRFHVVHANTVLAAGIRIATRVYVVHATTVLAVISVEHMPDCEMLEIVNPGSLPQFSCTVTCEGRGIPVAGSVAHVADSSARKKAFIQIYTHEITSRGLDYTYIHSDNNSVKSAWTCE